MQHRGQSTNIREYLCEFRNILGRESGGLYGLLIDEIKPGAENPVALPR
jgi:hypothetical protein